MVSVNSLLLLLLLMHPRVHLLVLLGPTCNVGLTHLNPRNTKYKQTCIWRSLTKVLRRAWTSLLRRGVGGEPWSCIGRGRVTPWTLGRTLVEVGWIRCTHDKDNSKLKRPNILNNQRPRIWRKGVLKDLLVGGVRLRHDACWPASTSLNPPARKGDHFEKYFWTKVIFSNILWTQIVTWMSPLCPLPSAPTVKGETYFMRKAWAENNF